MGCEGGEARGKGCESTRGSVERFGVLSGGGESRKGFDKGGVIFLFSKMKKKSIKMREGGDVL
jgi:hypothetical protein